MHVAKTKVLISVTVTTKLVCAFVFAQAFCWFSYAVAQMSTECFNILHHYSENILYCATKSM